ncbi:MAG: LysR family transcriptional regulator [Akkermansiaceae bacterium]|nr:LysR family transcriptional regulator [Armatimonadota bacterium]
MNEIELRHLRCIVMLADERNFGRAAARLHMSQPPLTRLLSEVERIVGAKLFERTTRRVDLTTTGEVFVAEAKAVLARAETAMETVGAAVRRQSGQLRIAYTPLALQTILPQIVSRLREREHDVGVDLVQLTGEAQREALSGAHVDMAFNDEPADSSGFDSLLLHREALQIMVPENHRLAATGPVHFSELADETFILHARTDYPNYFERVVAACMGAGWSPKIYQREAGQNCSALVTAGRGVLLTSLNFGQDSTPGLRFLMIEDAPATLYAEVWAILPRASGSVHLESLREIVRGSASNGEITLPR